MNKACATQNDAKDFAGYFDGCNKSLMSKGRYADGKGDPREFSEVLVCFYQT